MNRLQQAVEHNGGRTLLGAAVYFYDPIFLEICAHLGYQAIWIEMEHAPHHLRRGRRPLPHGRWHRHAHHDPHSRTRGAKTCSKAAECGPDILDVPMVDTPEQMHELREYARFAPDGGRGIF